MTTEFYYLTSCTSSRKARKILDENQISYTDQNMRAVPLTRKQLLKILAHTESGVYDILSTGGATYKKLAEEGLDFDELSLSELHETIQSHPTLLRSPILVQNGVMMTGYDSDKMDTMIGSRERRERLFADTLRILRREEDKMLVELGIIKEIKEEEEVLYA